MTEIQPLTEDETDELFSLLERVPLGTANLISVRTEELALLILREVIELRREMRGEPCTSTPATSK